MAEEKRNKELEWMFSQMLDDFHRDSLKHDYFARDIKPEVATSLSESLIDTNNPEYLYSFAKNTPENAKLLNNAIILNEVWKTLGLDPTTLTADITHKFDVNENQQELSAIIAELFGCTVEQAAGMLEICTKPDETTINAFKNNGDNLSIDLVRSYRRCRIEDELGIEIEVPTAEVEGPTK